MREFDKSDFETAGANFGDKVAKSIYKKYGASILTLGALLQEVDFEYLISADADEIIEQFGRMVTPMYAKMIRSICNALSDRIVKDFPIIEDDFNFEDDFADDYGDSPVNVYNIAFWDSFFHTWRWFKSQVEEF